LKTRVLFVALLLMVCGCGVNQQFLAGVDAGWTVIGPEYTDYVQSDSKLTADDKTTRLRTAKLMYEIIEEAKR
jgi:hypothetical protein